MDGVRALVVDGVSTRIRQSKYTRYHVTAFLLTFFSYALFHASRKSFSNVKPSMVTQWTAEAGNGSQYLSDKRWKANKLFEHDTDADTFLGVLDACFLGAYSVGLYISGVMGDRIEPRLMLSFGMWGSAVLILAFGYVTEIFHFYNKGFYIVTWLLCGFIQASGWPNEVAVMGNWFGRGSRGVVLGMWSACASIGNIFGAYIAAWALGYGYQYTFLMNGTLIFAGGCVIFMGLVNSPREVGLPDPSEDLETRSAAEVVIDDHIPKERPNAIGFFRAWLLPGVIPYALAYACLKFVNYSFFFWLPFYLTNALGLSNSTSDTLSTWYDWGGIAGGLIAGFITDRMGVRTPTIVVLLIASIGGLVGYQHSPSNLTINAILMTVIGFFIGGPSNLISGAVSADLGRNPKIAGNAEAIATVTGILDGTGSVGAAIGQILVPVIETNPAIGWKGVFYLFMVMEFLTAVCLIHPLIVEIKVLISKIRGYRHLRRVDDEDADDSPILPADDVE